MARHQARRVQQRAVPADGDDEIGAPANSCLGIRSRALSGGGVTSTDARGDQRTLDAARLEMARRGAAWTRQRGSP